VGGFLSDRLGRRTTLLAMALLHVVASFLTFLTSFGDSLMAFIAARFFVGGTIHSVWTCAFVLASEASVEKNRVIVGAVVSFGENTTSLDENGCNCWLQVGTLAPFS